MFESIARAAILRIAKRLDFPPATLFASAEVELKGQTALPIASGREADQLQFGDRGNDVRLAQRLLSGRGYMLLADGLFGLITDRVVRQFQRDHLLKENGILGQAEMNLLEGRSARWRKLLGGKIKSGRHGIVGTAKSSLGRGHVVICRVEKYLRARLLSISRHMA